MIYFWLIYGFVLGFVFTVFVLPYEYKGFENTTFGFSFMISFISMFIGIPIILAIIFSIIITLSFLIWGKIITFLYDIFLYDLFNLKIRKDKR